MGYIPTADPVEERNRIINQRDQDVNALCKYIVESIVSYPDQWCYDGHRMRFIKSFDEEIMMKRFNHNDVWKITSIVDLKNIAARYNSYVLRERSYSSRTCCELYHMSNILDDQGNLEIYVHGGEVPVKISNELEERLGEAFAYWITWRENELLRGTKVELLDAECDGTAAGFGVRDHIDAETIHSALNKTVELSWWDRIKSWFTPKNDDSSWGFDDFDLD
jgi:hypothetical protein